MQPSSLHPALQAFFDEHRGRTTAHRKTCNVHSLAMHDATQPVTTHLLELRGLLARAQMSADADGYRHKMRHLETRLVAGMNAAQAVRDAVLDLNDKLAEIERGFDQDEIEANIQAQHLPEARAAGAPTPPAVS